MSGSAVLGQPQWSTRDFADELHDLLVRLDPAAWSDDASRNAREALERLHAQAQGLLENWERSPPMGGAEQRLMQAVERVRGLLPDPAVLGDARAEWAALRERLAPAYEAMVYALGQEGTHARRLHPTNWTRSVFHVASGLGVALAYEHLLTPTIAILAAGAFAAWAWSLEIGRQLSVRLNDFLMWILGPITRHHERYRVNSATWFGTALLVLALVAPGRAAVMGLLVLAVADPVAGAVGRRFGRVRIANGRSLEGTSAFVVAGLAAVLGYLALYHPGLGLGAMLALAAAAVLVGALVELFSTRIDDNLAVPIAAALAAAGCGWLLGV